jgi:hypothetical protein
MIINMQVILPVEDEDKLDLIIIVLMILIEIIIIIVLINLILIVFILHGGIAESEARSGSQRIYIIYLYNISL